MITPYLYIRARMKGKDGHRGGAHGFPKKKTHFSPTGKIFFTDRGKIRRRQGRKIRLAKEIFRKEENAKKMEDEGNFKKNAARVWGNAACVLREASCILKGSKLHFEGKQAAF